MNSALPPQSAYYRAVVETPTQKRMKATHFLRVLAPLRGLFDMASLQAFLPCPLQAQSTDAGKIWW